jgi:hypothetical protein
MYRQMAQTPLVSGRAETRPRVDSYASRFGRWEDLASVRRKPRRTLAGDETDFRYYFPPELHPVVLHPLFAGKGEAVVEHLLVRRLYSYLDFTTDLETLAVIPVATNIARGRSGLILPEQMRADAFKIVTDEAWHAQFSYDFARQIEDATQVPRDNGAGASPLFIQRLDELRERLPQEVRGMEAIVFAIVSETLISGILSQIPRDERLPRPVRDLIRDHAEDEGRHHVYFRSVLRHLWPALTPHERRAIGPHIPAAVYAFLEPDRQQAAEHLADIGLPPQEIEQIIAESWPARSLRHSIAEAAGPVVRYFAEAGALDDDRTCASFAEAGLWPGEEGR